MCELTHEKLNYLRKSHILKVPEMRSGVHDELIIHRINL